MGFYFSTLFSRLALCRQKCVICGALSYERYRYPIAKNARSIFKFSVVYPLYTQVINIRILGHAERTKLERQRLVDMRTKCKISDLGGVC